MYTLWVLTKLRLAQRTNYICPLPPWLRRVKDYREVKCFATVNPTTSPTTSPTTLPTTAPTFSPTTDPTSTPTYFPTTSPTSLPTKDPTTMPTSSPIYSATNECEDVPGFACSKVTYF